MKNVFTTCARIAIVLGAMMSAHSTSASERPAESQQVDLLIENALVVTMDGNFRVIEHGAIAIEGSRIVAVGGPEVSERFDAAETIDAGGDIVMPGMINTHTHVSMTTDAWSSLGTLLPRGAWISNR